MQGMWSRSTSLYFIWLKLKNKIKRNTTSKKKFAKVNIREESGANRITPELLKRFLFPQKSLKGK
jgi:hypothetical protein